MGIPQEKISDQITYKFQKLKNLLDTSIFGTQAGRSEFLSLD